MYQFYLEFKIDLFKVDISIKKLYNVKYKKESMKNQMRKKYLAIKIKIHILRFAQIINPKYNTFLNNDVIIMIKILNDLIFVF